jgi:hypothetical protein
VVAAGLVVLAALGGSVAFYEQITHFSYYDDEGYVLVTLSQFLRGHPLYTAVFSQYGPTFYFVQWALLSPLAIPVTNDLARIETVVAACVIVLLAGVSAYRISGSAIAACLALVTTQRALVMLGNEPGHPQSLCLLLIAIAVARASSLARDAAPSPRRLSLPGSPLAWIAACAGLLITTKVNLGGFCVAAILMALAVTARPSTPSQQRLLRVARTVALPMVLLASFLLVRGLLAAHGWTRYLVLAFGPGLVFAYATAWHTSAVAAGPAPPWPSRRETMAAALAFGVAAIVPCLFVVLRGTRFGDLVHGVVLQHLGFDQVFHIGISQRGGFRVPVATAVGMGLGILLAFLAVRRWAARRAADGAPTALPLLLSGALRLSAALLVYPTAGSPSGLDRPSELLEALPMLFVAVVPPGAQHGAPQRFVRAFVVFLAVLEALWVYPVFGDQLGMAIYLPLVVAAISIGDGIREITGAAAVLWQTRFGSPMPPRLALVGAVFTVAVFAIQIRSLVHQREDSARSARQHVPLNLPGAKLIRLAPSKARDLRYVTWYLRKNSDEVVFLPGLPSFYLWLEREPPTTRNAGAWPILFDEKEQQALVDVYREKARTGRLLGLLHEKALKIWLASTHHTGDETQKPLYRYITEEFRSGRVVGDYTLLVPRE